MTLLFSAFFAAAALVLDYLLAEPRRFHPLVGFGNWANSLQSRFNPQVSSVALIRSLRQPWLQKLLGLVALALAIIPLFYFIFTLVRVLSVFFPWFTALLEIFLLYLCIGGRSLQLHVDAVKEALQQNDLALAREKLSWIVSRETSQLSADQVAQASIETTLENSSDAIFASLFWFAVGGAPLALLHRWLNTLDAMWGYKNPQFKHFGWAAAHLDDVMNWIPARLTSLCFCLLSPRTALQNAADGTSEPLKNSAWHCWRTQAKHCASPNGGPVMTSGAGAIQRRLSDGAYYHGQWQQKPLMGCGPQASVKDISGSVSLVKHALLLYMGLWLLAGMMVAGVMYV